MEMSGAALDEIDELSRRQGGVAEDQCGSLGISERSALEGMGDGTGVRVPALQRDVAKAETRSRGHGDGAVLGARPARCVVRAQRVLGALGVDRGNIFGMHAPESVHAFHARRQVHRARPANHRLQRVGDHDVESSCGRALGEALGSEQASRVHGLEHHAIRCAGREDPIQVCRRRHRLVGGDAHAQPVRLGAHLGHVFERRLAHGLLEPLGRQGREGLHRSEGLVERPTGARVQTYPEFAAVLLAQGAHPGHVLVEASGADLQLDRRSSADGVCGFGEQAVGLHPVAPGARPEQLRDGLTLPLAEEIEQGEFERVGHLGQLGSLAEPGLDPREGGGHLGVVELSVAERGECARHRFVSRAKARPTRRVAQSRRAGVGGEAQDEPLPEREVSGRGSDRRGKT